MHGERIKIQHSYSISTAKILDLSRMVCMLYLLSRGRTLVHMRYQPQPALIARFMTKNNNIFILYVHVCIWLYCDCFIWKYLVLCLIYTVVVLYCFVMCGCVCVCVCVGFVMCGHVCRFCNVWLFWEYVYCTLTEVFLTLTEVFACSFLRCKANARVKLAKTGHGPHSSILVIICVVLCIVCV